MGVQKRKAREKQARQEAILKAAQKVFFAKGLDQATIDDVAEKAELSKGTIYLYFKSKEELYMSVFLKGLDLLTARFRKLRRRFATLSAVELVREVRDIYYNFYMKYPEYFYISSLLYHGRVNAKIESETLEATHQKTQACLLVFSEIIERGIADGVFKEVDSWKTANGFWGAATGVMMLLNNEEYQTFIKIPVKELLVDTTELLIEGLKIEIER